MRREHRAREMKRRTGRRAEFAPSGLLCRESWRSWFSQRRVYDAREAGQGEAHETYAKDQLGQLINDGVLATRQKTFEEEDQR